MRHSRSCWGGALPGCVTPALHYLLHSRPVSAPPSACLGRQAAAAGVAADAHCPLPCLGGGGRRGGRGGLAHGCAAATSAGRAIRRTELCLGRDGHPAVDVHLGQRARDHPGCVLVLCCCHGLPTPGRTSALRSCNQDSQHSMVLRTKGSTEWCLDTVVCYLLAPKIAAYSACQCSQVLESLTRQRP